MRLRLIPSSASPTSTAAKSQGGVVGLRGRYGGIETLGTPVPVAHLPALAAALLTGMCRWFNVATAYVREQIEVVLAAVLMGLRYLPSLNP